MRRAQAPEPVVDERDWRARQAPSGETAQPPAQVAQKPGSAPPSRSGSQQQLAQDGTKQAAPAQAQANDSRPAPSPVRGLILTSHLSRRDSSVSAHCWEEVVAVAPAAAKDQVHCWAQGRTCSSSRPPTAGQKT